MVFGSLTSSSKKRLLYLGAPEAEAEANIRSRMSLAEVYEDNHDLLEHLSYEKFLLVGRKGSGKSAFARYTQIRAETEANLFVDFVHQDRIKLEEIVQIGEKNGQPFAKESIFKWLIYTHIIRLFSESEAAKSSTEYTQLRQFIRKNSGFVDITDYEAIEKIDNSSFEINVEPLKRFYRQRIKKDFSITSQKAPFYKLLPHLEEVIVNVFKSKTEQENQNSYVIFFDDLDVKFDTNNSDSVDSVVSLIRVTKSINNDLFSKNKIQAKTIILLRDDVEKYIVDKSADIAKIFASYATRINWYQDDFQRGDDENTLLLKKFINLRITKAFERNDLPYKQGNPWGSLVNEDEDYHPKTSFKYILDHTLFRPRDFLLFFLPLEDGNLKVPLSRSDVNSLIGKYSEELVKEFKGELTSFYSEFEIRSVFKSLECIHQDNDCSYKSALGYFESNYKGEKPVNDVLDDMFMRSIIGNKSINNAYTFKYREPQNSAEVYSLDKKQNIIMHYGFKVYFHKNNFN